MEFILGWSGPVIYGALALSGLYGVFCVVLLVRKINEKRFASDVAAESFLEELRQRLRQRDFDGAAELCDSPPYWAKAVPQLILVGLANKHRSSKKLRQLLAEKFERDVLAELEYRHSWIGTMVKSAPMLGLLGTVSGMILAFAKIATSQQTGTDPSALANDISLALFTTMYGLAVAIPLTVLGAWVQVRISKLQDSVQLYVGEFLDDLEATETGS
jgi:biopolymer transport protein ExbB/TolQ